MNGFEMLEQDTKTMLDNGLFSVPCMLTDKDGKNYGAKSLNSDIKCFAPFIGMSISLEEMTQITGDSCEATLNIDSLKSVIPEKGWSIEIYFPRLKAWLPFSIAEVHPDRMLGWYHFKLSMQKPQNESKRITRSNIGGY